jgi:mannose-6-phosphate isomerase
MAVLKLEPELVEKPWGRDTLPTLFGGGEAGRRIGEVWFTGEKDLALLAKYIFTGERLSIQVHPSEDQARAMGVGGGKHECWLILESEPGATIGLGLTREATGEELRAAALDGSIEQLVNWRPVKAGDFFYVPAGTVHAIGAGVSLLEFQQNGGVTFRLYDYGRPRELHLDDAIAVARPEPYSTGEARQVGAKADAVLVDGPIFSLVQVAPGGDGAVLGERRRWVLPLEGRVGAGDQHAGPGECLLVEPGTQLQLNGARVLIGAEGALG